MEQAITNLGARFAVDRQGAIGAVYAALDATVLRYLQRLVGRDDAEDVLQRVFYEVWRHNDRYDPSRSLEAWVLGIARNRAIDHLRRQRSTTVASENLEDVPGEDGRDWAERHARALEVRNALNRLPAEQREVLVLAYFGGYTRSQIATYLELPLGTVKARAFRGLRRLADLLTPKQQGTAASQPLDSSGAKDDQACRETAVQTSTPTVDRDLAAQGQGRGADEGGHR